MTESDSPPPELSENGRAVRDLIEGRDGPPPLARGERIAARYRVIEHVANGGFGVVYRVYDELLKRESILKLAKRRGGGPPAELTLDVPAGIRIQVLVDHGMYGDHCYLIYFPYLEGDTLQRSIERALLTEADALRAGHELALLLRYLNDRRSIIHRDVKPSNVFIDRDGDVWLLDFGLACSMEACRTSSIPCGTRGYVAPEAVRGGPLASQVDVFSTALSLYVSLGGAMPDPPAGTKAGQLWSASLGWTDVRRLKVSRAVKKLILEGCDPDAARRPDIQLWEEALGQLRGPRRAAGSTLAWLLTALAFALAGIALWRAGIVLFDRVLTPGGVVQPSFAPERADPTFDGGHRDPSH